MKRNPRVPPGREVNEARRPHTFSRPCPFQENKKGKKKRNPAAAKTHHEIHSSSATATTSRRRATKHLPRVSPYSPASIDPGFVEIGLVQLSQSVKATNVTRAQIYYIMAPCTHPGIKRFFCLIGKNGLVKNTKWVLKGNPQNTAAGDYLFCINTAFSWTLRTFSTLRSELLA